jgi:threonine aldolase
VAELCRGFDSVSVCLSKGLGAPAGTMLVGTAPVIERARRARKILGGAMRQAGIIAAAGLYALEHHVERLAEDHANARLLAERLTRSSRVVIELDRVETNIVVFRLAEDAPDAATVVARAAERGVLVFAFGPRTVRAVTHLDVDRGACERGAEILVEVAESSPSRVAPTEPGRP